MLLQIGADVRQADGGKVGELTRLVFDPDSVVVASLVVQPNRGDLNEVVVPGEVVQDADDQAAQLSVDQDTFDAFPPFAVDRNIAPPPDVDDVTSDLIKDPIDVPDVAPVGFATGVESIAYIPILEEQINVPPSFAVVHGNTHVYATDGDLGHLHQVITDGSSLAAVALVVERGRIFTHDTEIPVDAVRTVATDTIELSVPSTSLQAKIDG